VTRGLVDTFAETDPQIVALLETVIAEIRGLRGDLARDRRPPRALLSRADVDRLSRLLPAIAGAVGSELFTVNELLQLAAVRVVAAGVAPAALGQLLQRARGLPLHGYVVVSDATELHRRVWRLEAVVTV
jgi:hypothetical protein